MPHTWQIEPANVDYYGAAWYQRTFEASEDWAGSALRIEFEAVFHSASVWVNDKFAGEHLRKGYTSFSLDVTALVRLGESNIIRVRVNNSFDEHMLPRGRSSDWATDGGIYRPVALMITPKVFIERVEIDAAPDLASNHADVRVRAIVRNAGPTPAEGSITVRVFQPETGWTATVRDPAARYAIPPGASTAVDVPTFQIEHARLWHFDQPELYNVRLELSSGHQYSDTFGIRKIETRSGGFFLNGEPVRLMGVERMAGSNPEFGMAEPSAWIAHDHADLKELNCVYTRVHWQQDRCVLDWCDRHGILIQIEVPAWGPETFDGMKRDPSDDIMQNGIEQLREMIARDRNHPCVFSWGMCNEINGQNPPAHEFAERMFREAKKLDPKRLVTYASNSLQKTPERDVAGLMDYVMWNEYYGSWYGGTPADPARNLDEIHRAFPDKAIIISEYGYCACTPDRPEGDARRIEILRDHDRVFRERSWVAGLIFFCYNDYRTHVGDKGTGVMKQRVHGVVDLYGTRKPSFQALRTESSPIESVSASGQPPAMNVTVRARSAVPSYPLHAYKLRAIAYGHGDIPVEQVEARLPTINPGQSVAVSIAFLGPSPTKVLFDVMRPTGWSAYSHEWKK